MRLKSMSVPQALNGSKRNAECLGHGAASPVGGFARWFRAGQFQHFRDGPRRKRGSTGFARLVAQKSIDALLAISLLPTPDGGRLTMARRATSNTGNRSAESRTIFAR
jgi:hypothetical protein